MKTAETLASIETWWSKAAAPPDIPSMENFARAEVKSNGSVEGTTRIAGDCPKLLRAAAIAAFGCPNEIVGIERLVDRVIEKKAENSAFIHHGTSYLEHVRYPEELIRALARAHVRGRRAMAEIALMKARLGDAEAAATLVTPAFTSGAWTNADQWRMEHTLNNIAEHLMKHGEERVVMFARAIARIPDDERRISATRAVSYVSRSAGTEITSKIESHHNRIRARLDVISQAPGNDDEVELDTILADLENLDPTSLTETDLVGLAMRLIQIESLRGASKRRAIALVTGFTLAHTRPLLAGLALDVGLPFRLNRTATGTWTAEGLGKMAAAISDAPREGSGNGEELMRKLVQLWPTENPESLATILQCARDEAQDRLAWDLRMTIANRSDEEGAREQMNALVERCVREVNATPGHEPKCMRWLAKALTGRHARLVRENWDRIATQTRVSDRALKMIDAIVNADTSDPVERILDAEPTPEGFAAVTRIVLERITRERQATRR